MPRWWSLLGLCVLGVSAAACGTPGTTSPDPLGSRQTEPDSLSGLVVAQANAAPLLVLQTRPPADADELPYPTITGVAPLEVHFNLCRSSDADPDDSITWQFHFGDDDSEAFNPDGTFNPHFEHFCRTDHTYAAGRWVATVSVTDKHLEDQSGGVVALARTTQKLSLVVLPGDAGGAPAPPPPQAPTSRLVFVTSSLHTGALGGLDGADALCQARAGAAGRAGTFRAWLGDATGAPATRFTGAGVPYRLVDGTLVAASWDDLTDGSLENPIALTELGGPAPGPSGRVWTNVDASGQTAPPFPPLDLSCEGWSLGAGTGDVPSFGFARTGDAARADAAWTEATGAVNCTNMLPLYCVEQ